MCGCYYTSVMIALSHRAVVRMSALRAPLAPPAPAEGTQSSAESPLPRYCSGWDDTSPVESWISAASPTFPPFLKTSRVLWKQRWADAIRAGALKTMGWWSSSGSATAWLVPAAGVGTEDRQQGRCVEQQMWRREGLGQRWEGGRDSKQDQRVLRQIPISDAVRSSVHMQKVPIDKGKNSASHNILWFKDSLST